MTSRENKSIILDELFSAQIVVVGSLRESTSLLPSGDRWCRGDIISRSECEHLHICFCHIFEFAKRVILHDF